VVKPPRDPFGWPIFDRTTKQVGIVATRPEKQGIIITLDIRGLPPGVHGVHIHENPKCEAPSFATAGGHWNWTQKQHGHKNPRGHHAGDLGNISIPADGKVQATFLVPAKDRDPKLAGGLSIVIHAAADDERTDPSGNSGDRIACGLLFVRPE
jgi:Cu-Zn family superoxide dismutase